MYSLNQEFGLRQGKLQHLLKVVSVPGYRANIPLGNVHLEYE